jgi:hypothetical protein
MSRAGDQVAMSNKKTEPDLFEDVWIISGIFSSHYLLERLHHVGYKLTDEEIEIVEGKRNEATTLSCAAKE